jgi:hypothetical protein
MLVSIIDFKHMFRPVKPSICGCTQVYELYIPFVPSSLVFKDLRASPCLD